MTRNFQIFAYIWVIKFILGSCSEFSSKAIAYTSCNQTDLESELLRLNVDYKESTIIDCEPGTKLENLQCQLACMPGFSMEILARSDESEILDLKCNSLDYTNAQGDDLFAWKHDHQKISLKEVSPIFGMCQKNLVLHVNVGPPEFVLLLSMSSICPTYVQPVTKVCPCPCFVHNLS